MSLIPGYPEGSDITILNTAYVGKRRDEDGKLEKDYLAIFFRDNKTAEKKCHIIEEPEYTYYKTVDGLHCEHNLFFVEKEKVEPVTCKYSNLLKDIASHMDMDEYFYDNIKNGNPRENERLHRLSDVFMSDMNIEDYYRFLFGQQYTNNSFKLNKAYLDIETDNKNMLSDFPEPGECPINAVSYLDERSGISYQLILDNGDCDQVEVFKNEMKQPGKMDELRNFIINAVGGWKKAKKYGVYDLKYQFLFFKDERELLITLFKLIHQTCPDILLIWNMAFDLTYVIARLERLGLDPAEVICDPRIKKKFLKFYVDERNKNEFGERGDFVLASMFTVWLDQMIQYASRRKGRGVAQSYKLDFIGTLVAGVKKLDYFHITSNITLLPYLNFRVFSWYNIMDTIVQKCIEASTNDCEYIFTKCIVNNTRYQKGHRQSTYLANRFSKDFFGYGYIIGNNVNRWNEKPKMKYPGAMVGDPLHNSEYAMIDIGGRKVLVAANVIDYDYKSLYPSITLENNMAPNTQVGKLEINEQISYMEHPDMYTSDEDDVKYCRAGEFLENMMSDNILEFSKRWLHLGDVKDVISDMVEFFETEKPAVPMYIERRAAMYESNGKLREAMIERPYDGPRQAVYFYDDWKELFDSDELLYKVESGALL